MQNRYAGDVGDFGKLGLLRRIAESGLRIGVNWYLVPDERHNDDGKHVGYLTDPRYNGCDDALRTSLKSVIDAQRSVSALEALNLIPGAVYAHEIMHASSKEFSRREWHLRAIGAIKGADVAFLDPDNGLLVKSVSAESAKSVKYVMPTEVADYYAAGKSVIFYNHRCREPESVYLRRFAWVHKDPILKDAVLTGVTFKRGTVRDYILVLQAEHVANMRNCVEQMLIGPWGEHFSKLDLKLSL